MKWFKRSWWKAYEAERLLMPYYGRHVPDPHPSCARPAPSMMPRAGDVHLGNGLCLGFPVQKATEAPKEWWPK